MKQIANNRFLMALALVAGMLLGSCGGGQSPLGEPTGFGLHIPASATPGQGRAEFSLQTELQGGLCLVHINAASAEELRSATLEISYDPEAWQPAGSEGSRLLGGAGQLLEHGMDVRPGLLAWGQVQLAGSGAEPFSGSGRLATFTFRPGPAEFQRQASGLAPQVPDASWDEGSLELSWPYGNTGDYDQNSEVNIADLTPIGINFGEAVGDPLSAEAMVDGDGNGEINIADITPIGINYGNSLGGYMIWELDSPLDWNGVDGSPADFEIPFADAQGSPALDRLRFSHAYAADPGYRWLRLAAYSGEEVGQPTELFFTYPSLQPLFSVADPSGLAGGGLPDDPFLVEVPVAIPLQLLLQDETDVSNDPLSEYVLHGPAGALLSGNSLEFEASAAGDYYLTASYDGVPSDPYSIHFHVNEAPQALLSTEQASGHAPFTVLLDATASSDPDGQIVLVEWDFDNDGVFDGDSGAVLSIEHTYAQQGSFEVVVRVTDDAGASALSAPLEISVLPPNQPPVAVFDAAPLSGDTPLTVSFDATASSDPDGDIALAEWDFDFDGSFSADAQGLELEHVYTVPGEYQAVLRVTDDDGASTLATPKDISVGGNFPPLAMLRAVPNAGPSPLLVLLDASESTDPDGEIVLVEWDFGGDGEFDQSGTQLAVQRSYTGDGQFHPVVRLTDDSGGVSVSEPVTITVGAAAGSPPTAVLQATPQTGAAPLLVSFDAGASSDPDNDIVLLEYDFDNDGNWDAVDDGSFGIQHEYTVEGQYEAVLRATDSYGYRDTSAPVSILVSKGSPPTAHFNADRFSGSSPLDVLLDASGSSDPDGPVSLYEWDADGDGLYEFSSSSASAQLSLVATGTREVSLRVTDEDGLQDSISHSFTVGPPQLSWQDLNTGVVNPLNAHYAVAGGHPSITWQSGETAIYFKRSSDSSGHAWPVSGSLVDADLSGYPGGGIRLLGYTVSGGLPLLATLKGTDAQADHDLFVSRGLDSEGSGFAPAQKIVSGLQFRPDRDNRGLPLLAVFSGLPGISYGSEQSGGWHHIRALDSQGSDWPEQPSVISGSIATDQPFGSLLQDPAGGAQLFYFSSTAVQGQRDADGDGKDWGGRIELQEQQDVVRLQAISSSDSVLLLYTTRPSAGTYELYASHALAPAFASWSEPVQVATAGATMADAQLIVDGGKPVLLLGGNIGGEAGVYYMRSHNAHGSHWSQPLRISSQSGGELRGIAIVNGRLTALHLRANGNLRLLSRE